MRNLLPGPRVSGEYDGHDVCPVSKHPFFHAVFKVASCVRELLFIALWMHAIRPAAAHQAYTQNPCQTT
jgi:hypothetical protein